MMQRLRNLGKAIGLKLRMKAPQQDFSNLIDGFGVESYPDELVLGTFDRHLTVYDQQIKALNLAYRLKANGIIPCEKPIVVIGAGIAGLTFAAGCVWHDQKVHLLEKQVVPCHLQRGCDIRWLHPHIYHWPTGGAEQPFAGLPLLSWSEGTASEVAHQITKEWDRLALAGTSCRLLKQVYGATVAVHRTPELRIEWSGWVASEKSRRREPLFAPRLVVYAVGFGIETTPDGQNTHSYWENDSFNQLPPGSNDEQVKWLISGLGDGALVDLQRLKIESFRQGRIVRELFADHPQLVKCIRDSSVFANPTTFTELMDELDGKGFCDAVDKLLEDRLREDTLVTLHGRKQSFADAIKNSQASLLNRFMAYRLYRLEAFSYQPGTLGDTSEVDGNEGEAKKKKVTFESEGASSEGEFDQLVFRHGPNRFKWLEEAGYPACIALKEAVKDKSSDQEWDPGWWASNVGTSFQKKIAPGSDGFMPPREFVSQMTEAIATTFVKAVGGMLRNYAASSDDKFRVALHRVIPLNQLLRYQQISAYGGTRVDDDPSESSLLERTEGDSSATQKGVVGRIFHLNHLAVGLCVRGKRPYLLRARKSDGADLRNDMSKLHMSESDARSMKSTVTSIAVVPFYSTGWDTPDGFMTSLVLYVDSDSPTFFSRNVMNVLAATAFSFKEYIDEVSTNSHDAMQVVEWDTAGATLDELTFSAKEVRGLATLESNSNAYGDLDTFIKGPTDVSSTALTLKSVKVVDFA